MIFQQATLEQVQHKVTVVERKLDKLIQLEAKHNAELSKKVDNLSRKPVVMVKAGKVTQVGSVRR